MTEPTHRPRTSLSRLAAGLLLAVGLCGGQANAQVIESWSQLFNPASETAGPKGKK